MSANKKNRSLWGSRSEAQRIYYQRQTIKRLEKENKELKEKCEKQEYAIKENCDLRLEIEQLKQQRQELRNWLEKKLVSDIYGDDIYYGFKSCLLKLNKLEGDKNDKKRID